jgi:hypothetical protein
VKDAAHKAQPQQTAATHQQRMPQQAAQLASQQPLT